MYDKAKACLTKFCVPMFCFPLMTSLSPTYDVTTAPFHQGELYAFHFPFHQLLSYAPPPTPNSHSLKSKPATAGLQTDDDDLQTSSMP